MTSTMTLYCAGCRAERDFEQPPCADGHESACPDLVCVHCGLALFAFVVDDLVHASTAEQQRSAVV